MNEQTPAESTLQWYDNFLQKSIPNDVTRHFAAKRAVELREKYGWSMVAAHNAPLRKGITLGDVFAQTSMGVRRIERLFMASRLIEAGVDPSDAVTLVLNQEWGE